MKPNFQYKVSVCIITYNHEAFIKKCLDSILQQVVGFDYEIIIGEDCSTDDTKKIVERYESENQKIRTFENAKNIGALANFERTLKAAEGKYIAFCEGDDYWIDENKLQKQVDFLEQNPNYGGVCTNNRWYYQNEDKYQDSILPKGEITFEDLATSNKINSQTILFRSSLIDKLDWIRSLKIGDWPLHLMIANQKPYYRLPEITTVYRVHSGGVHSLLKEELKLRNRLNVLEAVLKHLDLTKVRQELIKKSIQSLLLKLISYYPNDKRVLRKMYLKNGGNVFNKTIIKSFVK